MAGGKRLIKRPRWWRLFARRRWERMFGAAGMVYVDQETLQQMAFEQQVKRRMKGIVGA